MIFVDWKQTSAYWKHLDQFLLGKRMEDLLNELFRDIWVAELRWDIEVDESEEEAEYGIWFSVDEKVIYWVVL